MQFTNRSDPVIPTHQPPAFDESIAIPMDHVVTRPENSPAAPTATLPPLPAENYENLPEAPPQYSQHVFDERAPADAAADRSSSV